MMRMRATGLALILAVALVGCSSGSSEGPGQDTTTTDVGRDVTPDISLPPDAGADTGADIPTTADVVDTEQPQDTTVEPDAGECREGMPCDDGNPCTSDDRCTASGDCSGEPYACDDGRPCTDDLCDGFGDCTFAVAEGYCFIRGQCVPDGETVPSAPCLRCDAAESPTEGIIEDGRECDDGNPCTSGDHCDQGICVSGETEVACDDGDICTDDTCIPGTGCSYRYNVASCDDGNPCTGPDRCFEGHCLGQANCGDGNPCTTDYCDPEQGCVHQNAAEACDDGDVCTSNDFCSSGVCQGTLKDCDDGNPCTIDWCHPVLDCMHEYANGAFCSDGNPCTVGDSCQAGECESGTGTLNCDDDNICTVDSCDPDRPAGCYYEPSGIACCDGVVNICDDGDPCTTDDCGPAGECVYEFNNAPCNDANACTEDDFCLDGVCDGLPLNCDDGNPCTNDSCDLATGCQYAVRDGSCNDGNACTLNDYCQAGTCYGEPLNCDDGNACTDDDCIPETGCSNVFNTEPCNDGDVCTVGDACSNGSCTGTLDSCDDGNDCTTDTCVNPAGCRHTPRSTGACNDGRDCTVNDICLNGVCLGDDSGCVCDPLDGPAVTMIELRVGTKGWPGEGLDLDENPNTCAPPGTCRDGIDNAMALISSFANPEITKALDEGSLYLLFQHVGFRTDGGEYMFTGFPAEPVVEGCPQATQVCDFLIDPGAFTEECGPLISIDNATVNGNTFHVGGPGHNFLFELPLMEGLDLELVLYYATVEGTITYTGNRVTRLDGILAGAVPKETIREAILAIPPDQLPMDPNQILIMLDTFLRNDIDTDGDGQPDAVSVGLPFVAVEANIVGTQQPD